MVKIIVEWNDIIKALKENCQLKILYSLKMSFKIEVEKKNYIEFKYMSSG